MKRESSSPNVGVPADDSANVMSALGKKPRDGIAETLIEKVLLIRKCEERILQLFSEGRINGTVHTCIGQEWSGVAVLSFVLPEDYVLSNHRGHGHYIACTDDAEGLIAEVMGRSTGVCRGVGGSQHLQRDRFYSNGVQGGMAPVAAGLALAQRREGKPGIVFLFIGDGTLGEGVLYEAMNLCAIWSLSVLFIVENNGIAQSTETRTTTAGSIRGRAEAFGLRYFEADTWDVKRLLSASGEAVHYLRTAHRPAVLHIETCRLRAHSKGDDTRDEALVREYEERDWTTQILKDPDEIAQRMLEQIQRRLDSAVQVATAAPLGGIVPTLEPINKIPLQWRQPEEEDEERFNLLVNRELEAILAADPASCLIGEDLLHPYGGAFKVARDLSQKYPRQVFSSPISEAAIIGMATGLALAGHCAVAEIMFGDFLTLTLDQLLQHASKFVAMYGQRLPLPLIVRTPMGGRRGYGPTHSQSIEKHFLGIPNLHVAALNHRCPPRLVYSAVRATAVPWLVIENKVLYTRRWNGRVPDGYMIEVSSQTPPTVRLRPGCESIDVTVVCYGGQLESVEAAILKAFDEDEVVCEVICPSLLYPLDLRPILESARRSRRVLLTEEGPTFAAWGAEVIAQLVEAGLSLKAAVRLGHDGIIPACYSRECELLPNPESIAAAIRRIAMS